MIHVPNRMSSFEMFAMSPTVMLQEIVLFFDDDATVGRKSMFIEVDRLRKHRIEKREEKTIMNYLVNSIY